MQTVLRGVVLNHALVLNGLVLLAEPDVRVRVQLCHVLCKFVDTDGGPQLTAYFDGRLPVHLQLGRLARWVVQVVVRGVETFPERNNPVL